MLCQDGRVLVPRRMDDTPVVEAQALTGIMDSLEKGAG
jgi:hypothetical protein